jgi:hypothetical protein
MKRVSYKKFTEKEFADKFYETITEGLKITTQSDESVLKINYKDSDLLVNIKECKYGKNNFQIEFILDGINDKSGIEKVIDHLKLKRELSKLKNSVRSVDLQYMKLINTIWHQIPGYWTSMKTEQHLSLNMIYSNKYEMGLALEKYYEYLSLNSKKKLWKRLLRFERKSNLESFIWFWNYLIYSMNLKFDVKIWDYNRKEKKSKFLIDEKTPLYITTKKRERDILLGLERKKLELARQKEKAAL